MTILAVDTSGFVSSVALKLPDGSIACLETESVNSHDEELVGLVRKILEDNSLSISDVSVLLAGSGPGSFTGLRIGFSVLKGLAATTGLPLYVIPTFQAAAVSASKAAKLIAVIGDARRKEMFFQLFSVESGPVPVPLDEISIVNAEQASRVISERLTECGYSNSEFTLVGSGLKKLISELEWEAAKGFSSLGFSELSRNLIMLYENGVGVEKAGNDGSEIIDLAEAKPLYVRAVAAQTIEERQKR